MRLSFVLFICGLCLFSQACKESKSVSQEDDVYFGEQITEEGAITYEDLLSRMKISEEVEAKVKGKVESVCQAKGCWMNIVSSDENIEEEMFVKFKDYGFFMPLDISGREVIMRGKAFKEETSVEELRHYAEDEGKSAEEIAAINESIVELKFMADGVILLP